MNFRSEVDTEAEKLIKEGTSPTEALKRAVLTIARRRIDAIAQTEKNGQIINNLERDSS